MGYGKRMFTGLIRYHGTVLDTTQLAGDTRLRVNTEAGFPLPELGDSIAIDGVCLSVVAAAQLAHAGVEFAVDLSPETIARCRAFAAGARVHLEPALRVGDALGGHFVQGHIDGVAVVESMTRAGDAEGSMVAVFRVQDVHHHAALAPKGSISINGVSLTLNTANEGVFAVNLIPITLAKTTLGTLQAGDKVNIELDVFARYALAAVTALGTAIEAMEVEIDLPDEHDQRDQRDQHDPLAGI